jgi:hypothetical protein
MVRGTMTTLSAPATSKALWCCPEGFVIQDVIINGVTSADVTIHGVRDRKATEFRQPTDADLAAGTVGIAIWYPSPMYPSATTEHKCYDVANNKYVGIVLSNNGGWSPNACHIAVTWVPAS